MRPVPLTPRLFEVIAHGVGEHLVSVAIPTHRRGREVHQDRIHLKNALDSVASDLEDLGVRRPVIEAQLATGHAREDDPDFWEHQATRLVLYADDRGATTAIAIDDDRRPGEHQVATRFCIRYLLPALDRHELPVLALSRGAVGLFRLGDTGIERLEADLPESFEAVNWFVDREEQRQQHPGRAGSERNRHGHGVSEEDPEDLARFLRAVDAALPDAGPDSPLILLGDDRLVGHFSDIHDGPILRPEHGGIPGTDPARVRELATPAFEAYRSAREGSLRDEAKRSLATGGATASVREAVTEARSGRIGRLVVYAGVEPVWGSFDPSTTETAEPGRDAPENVDLVDLLLHVAVESGAQIAVVTDPIDGAELVAVRRY